jgi:hypothetical protein
MKLKFLSLAPVSVLLFATACATTDTATTHTTAANAAAAKPYIINGVDDSRCLPFHDAKSANLVLEYYRPDTIYMKRPDAHEGNFLTIFTRDNITTEVEHRVTQRDTAAIVLGYMYSPEQEAAIFKEWESVMKGCGFQRVVFLRANRSGKIEGLPVLHDSAIADLNEPTRLVANSPLARN